MLANKEMADRLYKEYRECLYKEEESYKKIKKLAEKLKDANYENEEIANLLRETWNENKILERETNAIARLVIKYAFDEGGVEQ